MLIGNKSILNKSPGRFLSGTVGCLRSSFSNQGMIRNTFENFDHTAAWPYGHLSPSAWVLPKTAGGMSSINFTGLDIAASGSGAMGVNGVASAVMIFGATATGALIVSGGGTANFTITATGNSVATLNAAGSASMTFTPIATIGALAWQVGSATITFSGSLGAYGIGNMIGSTDVASVITNDSVAAAVWSAIASAYNVSGTMGNKLNLASSGGVDYAALAAAILAAAAADPIAANIKEVNSLPIDGAGTEADPFGPV